VTDQSQSGPPEPPDDGSGSIGDVPAALGPDTPPDVAPAPPPPPAAIASAMDGQDVELPAAVAPLAPGESSVVSPPPIPPGSESPAWRPEDDLSSGGPAALAAERPEIAVGAAFAGGLVLALILKRLAR
jgi:hypothetical protein